jgi:septum formation protein
MTTLYLASTSPARHKILKDIGLTAEILTPTVDEEQAVRDMAKPFTSEDVALHLARLKAESVLSPDVDGVVIGGDSVFDFGGHMYGKPLDPDIARERWHTMRGNRGTLHSGLWLIDNSGGQQHKSMGMVSSALVTFCDNISDAEIDAYVATGEPLNVAGAFTLDSRGSAFIQSIEGDPYAVVGLSAYALRTGLLALGLGYHQLWEAQVR